MRLRYAFRSPGLGRLALNSARFGAFFFMNVVRAPRWGPAEGIFAKGVLLGEKGAGDAGV